MAKTDLETLVVRMEAQMRAFENELKRGRQTADRETRAIERRFADANKKIAASFSSLGPMLSRGLGVLGIGIGGSELAKFADQFTRIQNALRITGLEGAALTQVYDALFASAQKNAAPLEALATLYGRVSLVQNELKVSTGELLQFTDNIALALRVSGQSAEQSSGALLQLSQALGSGVVRAEEFNSILEGALPIAQAAARGIEEAGGSVAKLRQLVVDGKVSSEAFFRGFQVGSASLAEQAGKMQMTIGQAITQLRNVFVDAVGKLDATSQTSKGIVSALNDFSSGIQQITRDIDATTKPFRDFLDVLRQIDQVAQSAALWVGRVTGANKIGPAVKNALGISDDVRRGITAPDLDLTGGMPGLKPAKPIKLSDFPVDAKKKAEREKLDPFERALSNANKRIEVERAETAAINDGVAARERAKLVAELEVAAIAANKEAKLENTAVTVEQNAKIQETADKMYAVAAAAEAANGPMARAARSALDMNANLQELGVDVVDDLARSITDVASGTKTAAEAFKDMAQSILRDLTQMMIKAALWKAIMGFTGPGPTSYSGTGNPWAGGGMMPIGPGRASGGPVSPGTVYPVGERGMELFAPQVPGRIIPNSALGGKVVNNVQIVNNSSARVSQQQKQNDTGGMDIIAIVEDAVAGAISSGRSRINQAVEGRYGLDRTRGMAG